MLTGVESTPLVRIWQNSRALVVPRAFRNRAGFAEASADCDCPVLLRLSGGTAVMHGPHILNISRFNTMPRSSPVSIASAFTELGQVLCDALADCGIAASMGDVHGAHCPGRYSVQISGRKLAGTAGFVRERGGIRVVVAHASVFLSTHSEDLDCIEKFENALGSAAKYDANAHTSLEDECLRINY